MARKLQGRSPLALLRIRAGLDQATAAEKLGITQQGLSRLETGISRPSNRTLSKLIKLYGGDANVVFTAIQKTVVGSRRRRAA